MKMLCYRFERKYSYTYASATDIRTQLIEKDNILYNTLSVLKGDPKYSTANVIFTNTITNCNDDLSSILLNHMKMHHLNAKDIIKIAIDSRIIENINIAAFNTEIGKTWTKVSAQESRRTENRRKYGAAVIHPNIEKMLDTCNAMFPKLKSLDKPKAKNITIVDFGTTETEFENLRVNIMNAIKESYTNRQIPQNYKKLIVINPVYMNKTVMKLFGNEPKYRITYHCQVIILILILFYNFKSKFYIIFYVLN